MTKHIIDIEEDLPEGFTAVELALSDNPADEVINDNGNTMYVKSILKLQKTKPRRIVLEETDEIRNVRDDEWYQDTCGKFGEWCGEPSINKFKIWRKVE